MLFCISYLDEPASLQMLEIRQMILTHPCSSPQSHRVILLIPKKYFCNFILLSHNKCVFSIHLVMVLVWKKPKKAPHKILTCHKFFSFNIQGCILIENFLQLFCWSSFKVYIFLF